MMAQPPLFDCFPALAETVPHCSFGAFPTPVDALDCLSRETRRENLFVKRDDLSGTIYGGNKIRKLEFLLAAAKQAGAKRVITFGAAGSNHALATAIYARETGLHATLILADQPRSESVCSNLRGDLWAGAEIIYERLFERFDRACTMLSDLYERDEGVRPCVIPVGGSSAVGAIGFVNGAFELKNQIDRGEIAEPSAIYVPLGTMGTVAGLLLGCIAAGIKSHIVAVRVVPSAMASVSGVESCFRALNALLRNADPSFPDCTLEQGLLTVNREYYEPGYGLASSEVVRAVETAYRECRLRLDTTYSGKAFAAFCRAAREQGGSRPLLFWNTKNSRTLPPEVRDVDLQKLPRQFQGYF
ncbi:MAG: pyridoxal-phosphate dependent enzyme [Chitinispirillaceae bacterium]|jgi:D-cysteine desulfhydrase|nr:pyridoxal-phosphate dependent enzyme [Chitinispirillaceae bacterium]